MLEAEEDAARLNILFFLSMFCSVFCFIFCCFLKFKILFNPKVWALLEAEEDAAGLKMKETLEQLHQSGKFVKNKQPKWAIR